LVLRAKIFYLRFASLLPIQSTISYECHCGGLIAIIGNKSTMKPFQHLQNSWQFSWFVCNTTKLMELSQNKCFAFKTSFWIRFAIVGKPLIPASFSNFLLQRAPLEASMESSNVTFILFSLKQFLYAGCSCRYSI